MSHAERLVIFKRLQAEAAQAYAEGKTLDDCPYPSTEIGDTAWYWSMYWEREATKNREH
jgi:hypothetical protein